MIPGTESAPARGGGFATSVRTVGIFVGGVFAVLLIRLWSVQVLTAPKTISKAEAQSRRAEIRAGTTLAEKVPRAPILDRQGRILARSWFEHDLVLDVAQVVAGRSGAARYEAATRAADGLEAAVVGAGAAPEHADLRAAVVRALGTGPKGGPAQWLRVARNLDPRQRRIVREALERAGIRGFSFEDRVVRSYPFGACAAQVVGFVGEDAGDGPGRIAGRAGIEKQLDRVLDGTPGAFVGERDKDGREFLPAWILDRGIRPGAAVVLTIDAEIQRICMEVLEQAVAKSRAEAASAVVLSARTGEVLAAASWPTADPADLDGADLTDLNLRAFIDLYEPGSTVKPMLIGWALQQKAVSWQTTVDCGGPDGVEFFGARKVEEYIANPRPLTTEGVLIKSSNVGACRIAYERLGIRGMYDALESFRVAGRPAIEYPIPGPCRYTARTRGEQGGVWTGCSFPQGYEIMLSPLGLARVFLAFARRGAIVEPSLVRELRTADGVIAPPPHEPEREFQALDPEIAGALLGVLERVVEEGTARQARSAKWSIGGKTGTPKITGTNWYNPVFCGIAPVRDRDPEIVVVLQQHKVVGRGAGTYSGGAMSAPFASQIIERTLTLLGIPPEEGRPEKPAAGR